MILVAITAALMALAPPLYFWYTSVPVSAIVNAFNDSDIVAGTKVLQEVTEEEVIAAVKADLAALDAPQGVRTTLRRISDYHRVPADAKIHHFMEGQNWAMNLEFMTGPNAGYALRVRETPIGN